MHTSPRILRTALGLAVGLGLAAAAPGAHAAPLLGGLGGASGYGTNYLLPNDDGSSCLGDTAGAPDMGEIDLTTAFPMGLTFFGANYHSVCVNNNGNITFGGGVSTYTPEMFPVSDQRMIAPWWGDVDTSAQNVPTEAGVFWDVRPGQFTATWHNVGFFLANNTLRNDFQVILRSFSGCGIGAFDVEFRYNHCQWTAGDASGGADGHCGAGTSDCTPAQAGFDAGDRVHFYALPGSLMESIVNLCTSSNVGEPGVWRFRIRAGELPCESQGNPCDTHMMGACGAGTIACHGGVPACEQNVAASTERCDGVDNDCNGMIDEGDLCPADQICDRGQCVPRCVEGGCFEGQTCSDRGACVDNACMGVTCPAGQRCQGGTCVEACVGIHCPVGTVCRSGGCVDPCAGVHCDTGTVCDQGRCVVGCDCRQCQDSYSCNSTSGVCEPTDCVGMDCPPGQVCISGLLNEGGAAHCGDPCENAVCPRDQHCAGGACVAGSPPDAGGGDASTSDDGGGNTGDSGGGTGDAGDAGRNMSDASGAAEFGVGRQSGCNCRTAGATHPAGRSAAPALALAALAMFATRRRRR